MHQGGTATGNNALFKGCAGGGDCVLNAVLTFLGLNLGCSADLDDTDTSGQLCQAFFELFAVPFRIHALDFAAQLVNALSNLFRGAGTFDDGGGVLGDGDAASATELVHGDTVKGDTQFTGNNGALGENGEVLQNRFAAVTKTGCLESNHV